MTDLSIIVPSIRMDKLKGLYESARRSFSGSFEFIVCGPYKPAFERGNMRWIPDWGSSTRCQQIALQQATGKYTTRAVDDGLYEPKALDIALRQLEGLPTKDRKGNLVVLKNTESNESVDIKHPCYQNMNDPDFYLLSHHKQTIKAHVNPNYKLISFGLFPTSILHEIGGYDCRFEGIAIADLDLAIRLQMYDVVATLSEDIVIKCGWLPGHEGDHGPMHDCFAPDMEKYSLIYSKALCMQRIIIDIDNWKDALECWERRFKK